MGQLGGNLGQLKPTWANLAPTWTLRDLENRAPPKAGARFCQNPLLAVKKGSRCLKRAPGGPKSGPGEVRSGPTSVQERPKSHQEWSKSRPGAAQGRPQRCQEQLKRPEAAPAAPRRANLGQLGANLSQLGANLDRPAAQSDPEKALFFNLSGDCRLSLGTSACPVDKAYASMRPAPLHVRVHFYMWISAATDNRSINR